jgi:hypothetical protein
MRDSEELLRELRVPANWRKDENAGGALPILNRRFHRRSTPRFGCSNRWVQQPIVEILETPGQAVAKFNA